MQVMSIKEGAGKCTYYENTVSLLLYYTSILLLYCKQ